MALVRNMTKYGIQCALPNLDGNRVLQTVKIFPDLVGKWVYLWSNSYKILELAKDKMVSLGITLSLAIKAEKNFDSEA